MNERGCRFSLRRRTAIPTSCRPAIRTNGKAMKAMDRMTVNERLPGVNTENLR
jgi:hypothetical protein